MKEKSISSEYLCKILSDCKVLSYKIHVLHTAMQWELFLSYHPFLGEVYDFLEDQIDVLMEDIEQLGYKVPVSLDEMLEESDIIELQSVVTDPNRQMEIVNSDLDYLIGFLQKGINESWAKNDMVIQNNLIDIQKQLRIFQRKNRRMMWKK